MKLGELRDSIAHKWGDGNNTSLQNRIKLSIVAARATIIQRRYDSTKLYPQSLIQTAKSINLVRVNAEEFPLGDSNFVVKRTWIKVPKPLIVKADSYFVFIGTLSLARGFSYVPFEDVQFIKERKFSSRDYYYTYNDDYIYTINWKGSGIRMRYVPENIVNFKNFATNENEDTIEDEDIELEDSLIEGIESLVEERRFKVETGKEDSEIQINEQ